ncbi:GPN-loop GTPase 1 [Conglomerata obtusa]
MTSKQIFVVVGMAGSGKSTFTQRLYSWISQQKYQNDPQSGLNKYIFSLNLDPAVLKTKMPLDEDIRDTIDYNEVMEKHKLGPNGALTTCLNLYLLQVDTLLNKIQAKDPEYVIIDTPGQIEAFTWSSPGFVLVEALKSLNHSIRILYVIDADLSSKHEVFMSNMVYAASLSCRYGIDCHCIFNKADLVSDRSVVEWMQDYNVFRDSLDENEMFTPMLGSLALYLEEFYNYLQYCFVSSLSGFGREDFFKMINNNKNCKEFKNNGENNINELSNNRNSKELIRNDDEVNIKISENSNDKKYNELNRNELINNQNIKGINNEKFNDQEIKEKKGLNENLSNLKINDEKPKDNNEK